MFGCLKPFFSSPVITADLVIQQKEKGTLVGVVFKRLHGQWSARLGELTRADQLHLYKTATDVKTYNLANMKKILLGTGQNSTHVKMSLRNGEKLYLKIKGPDRLDWGARITQCKFPEEEPFSTMPSSPLAPPTPMPHRRMGYRHYVTDSSEMTSSIHLGYSPASSVASMQPTQHPQEEDETTDMDESLVARMAKIFEPEYRPKTGTLPRRIR